MKISDLPRERQEHLEEMRATGKDENHQDILVGLTAEETEFYLGYVELEMTGEANQDNGKRYLELHDKHEKVRFEVLGAEHILRTEKPYKH